MKALESFVRIPAVLAILSDHPAGLPLHTVAAEVGVDAHQLRAEILTYYTTDIPPHLLLGLQRAEAIEFLAADGDEADPASAPVIRIASDKPEAELGVEYLRADQLAELYRAAHTLSEVEPDNVPLSRAVGTLADAFLGRPATESPAVREYAAVLRRALDERRAVEIEYSRAWRPGVGRRIVHPYAMRSTRRGWELDAGPLEDGAARTFIVALIRSVTVLDTRFERPDGIAELLRAERTETDVEFSLPQGTHWVADRFAESTEVLDADADDLHVRAKLLPPVADRVGLILLIAGAGAFVIWPPEFAGSGAGLAERLLAHHGLA